MGRTKKKNTPENLKKMNNILAYFKSSLHVNLKKMEIAQTRLQGAEREVVKRRFIFDIQLLHPLCIEAKSKVRWAERMVETISNAIAEKERQKDDARAKAKALKKCCMSENITHNPFRNLVLHAR